MTASPHDAPLSALREHVDDLAAWEARSEPDAHARRCAGTRWMPSTRLYSVRQQLITEIRQADDATAARADALLREVTQEGGDNQ